MPTDIQHSGFANKPDSVSTSVSFSPKRVQLALKQQEPVKNGYISPEAKARARKKHKKRK